ncbi:hypothetical protein LR004_01585 [Candidatus Gracilibacteria bacterium]|nr:hypothetical protein [Candidatus Gracilibacteria bacterium]
MNNIGLILRNKTELKSYLKNASAIEGVGIVKIATICASKSVLSELESINKISQKKWP